MKSIGIQFKQLRDKEVAELTTEQRNNAKTELRSLHKQIAGESFLASQSTFKAKKTFDTLPIQSTPIRQNINAPRKKHSKLKTFFLKVIASFGILLNLY